MARFEDRKRAIELRLAGQTYTAIKTQLKISKGTLSDWLKNIPLSPEQIQQISRNTVAHRVETYIKNTRAKRENIFKNYCSIQKQKLLPLNKRELLIAGLFLYLGEGSKSRRSLIQITNSDPSIIKFSLFWITQVLGIPRNKLRIQLHLYKDMSIENEINFWLKTTGLRKEQIIKPYIKKTTSLKINHPSFGHGTCSLYTCNSVIKDEIMAGIKVILDSVITGM